jgi:hypothetical protein
MIFERDVRQNGTFENMMAIATKLPVVCLEMKNNMTPAQQNIFLKKFLTEFILPLQKIVTLANQPGYNTNRATEELSEELLGVPISAVPDLFAKVLAAQAIAVNPESLKRKEPAFLPGHS